MADTDAFAEPLLGWYGLNKRSMPWRETRDPYHIWLSEVMLQQTQVATVIPYYLRFIEKYPNLCALARARDEDVLKLWEGLGYYRRCHHFLAAVRCVKKEHGGKVPDDPELFSNLPGVGAYTTAAVMSIAYGHCLPVVDGNVIRVVARYDCMGEDSSKTNVRNKIRRRMEAFMPAHAPGDFNQAVMELGAMVCTPRKPLCGECPLNDGCCALETGGTSRYPNIPRKAVTPEYNVALGLIVRDRAFLVQKRPEKGHLAGMWELPGGKTLGDESLEAALQRKCRDELELDINVGKPLITSTHVYSHFRIRVTVFVCTLGKNSPVARKGQPLMWIREHDLDAFPFPAVNHKCFPAIREFFSDLSV